MADHGRWPASAEAISAMEYVRAVADDRHLAAEFAQLSSLGDSPDALRVVAEAAADILERCLLPTTSQDHGSSRDSILETIEHRARQADECGDQLQALWCRILAETLLDCGWPAA